MPTAPVQKQFPCKQCGASLEFAPGTSALKCPYCGTQNEIAISPQERVASEDFRTALARLAGETETQDSMVIRCDGCGAETSFKTDVVADKCPFCGHALVAAAKSSKQLKPKSLLPFGVTKEQAGEAFVKWVHSLWFAPNELKRTAERAGINGAYIPAWTYDADTFTQYTGQRGDDYWETETYTEQDVNGNTVTRTRQVRRTRWTYVSGAVALDFDDILVLATRTLPPKCAQRLEPWDLPNLVPYRDEFLSGFVCESYQVSLEEGFDTARGIMDGAIRQAICRDIGGDHQQIDSTNTQFGAITFKHILLPMWISAYRYRMKTYRFLVNARTSEVQGERPYSVIKILMLIFSILAAIILAIVLFQRFGGH